MKFLGLFFAPFLVLWLAFYPRLEAAESEPPVVVATTTMIGSMLELLSGEELEIRVLIPPGACPGHFELAREQKHSVVFVVIYLLLEKMEEGYCGNSRCF